MSWLYSASISLFMLGMAPSVLTQMFLRGKYRRDIGGAVRRRGALGRRRGTGVVARRIRGGGYGGRTPGATPGQPTSRRSPDRLHHDGNRSSGGRAADPCRPVRVLSAGFPLGRGARPDTTSPAPGAPDRDGALAEFSRRLRRAADPGGVDQRADLSPVLPAIPAGPAVVRRRSAGCSSVLHAERRRCGPDPVAGGSGGAGDGDREPEVRPPRPGAGCRRRRDPRGARSVARMPPGGRREHPPRRRRAGDRGVSVGRRHATGLCACWWRLDIRNGWRRWSDCWPRRACPVSGAADSPRPRRAREARSCWTPWANWRGSTRRPVSSSSGEA